MNTTQDAASGRPGQAEAQRPDAKIPLWALNRVTQQAECAVDETTAQLRDAEKTRDDLARQLGAQQELIDRLQFEMDRRSQLLRQLLFILPGTKHDPE